MTKCGRISTPTSLDLQLYRNLHNKDHMTMTLLLLHLPLLLSSKNLIHGASSSLKSFTDIQSTFLLLWIDLNPLFRVKSRTPKQLKLFASVGYLYFHLYSNVSRF